MSETANLESGHNPIRSGTDVPTDMTLAVDDRQGHTCVVTCRQGVLTYQMLGDDYTPLITELIVPSRHQWRTFRDTLRHLHIDDWKSLYQDDVIRGTLQWSVWFHAEGFSVSSFGTDACPPNWDEFCRAVRTLLNGRPFGVDSH